MKPVMILDMSTLQSLSHGESQRLQHHFFLNVPQVMLFETLADLEQHNSDSARGQTQVKAWATRMLQPGILFNMWHRDICLAQLMGAEVEMCGAAIPQPPRKVRGSDGEVLTVHDVTWQNQSLIRWLEGKFADDERSIAKEWRETSCLINIEKYKQRLADNYVVIPRVSNLRDVVAAVDDVLSNPHMQDFCLGWLMEVLSIKGDVRRAIQTKWRMRSNTYLKAFAPYAHFCARVNLAYVFGLIQGQISSDSRKKTRVDLEYCYYLPFCAAFASTDRFHRSLAPLLLRENQDFIEGNVLREDLKRLDEDWQSLTPDQKRQRDIEYGDYPVENLDSVIWKIWHKQAGPRTSDYGNRAPLMTKENSEELVSQLRSAMQDKSNSLNTVESTGRPVSVRGVIRLIVPRSEVAEQFPNFEEEKRRTIDTKNPTS